MASYVWNVKHQIDAANPSSLVDDVMSIILANRGISNSDDFFAPRHPSIWTWDELGIKEEDVKKGLSLIHKSIDCDKKIIIYGDYDADGITSGVIMSEFLKALGAKYRLYLPDRKTDGYGMKVARLEQLLEEDEVGLVITVDQGIVAHEAIAYLRERQVDVLLTDHHQLQASLPDANVIIHSTAPSGSGLVWRLVADWTKRLGITEVAEDSLELAAIGTVTDVMPLHGYNRSVVWHGLELLRKTKRVGLRQLFEVAQIQPELIEAYHIGFQIGPRINAAGRIESAMTSAMLLLEKDVRAAYTLAYQLDQINRERQGITDQLVRDALGQIKTNQKLLIVKGDGYDDGIIGLVAGKVLERYYRPTIVLSMQGDMIKASCRSVSGVNITELLRTQEKFLESVGGHELAAGFSIKPELVDEFVLSLMEEAERRIDDSLLIRRQDIDLEVPLDWMDFDLLTKLEMMSPFGMGNSKPVFLSRGLGVRDVRQIGSDGKHLKILVEDEQGKVWDAIGFNLGNQAKKMNDEIDLVYKLSLNTWRGRTSLQLQVVDFE